MYLSPVVRRMRDDPLVETSVTLVVRVGDDATGDDVRATVPEVDGTIEDETRFGGVLVSLPQPAVDTFLAALPDTVEAVETSEVIGVAGDAGEDVRPEG